MASSHIASLPINTLPEKLGFDSFKQLRVDAQSSRNQNQSMKSLLGGNNTGNYSKMLSHFLEPSAPVMPPSTRTEILQYCRTWSSLAAALSRIAALIGFRYRSKCLRWRQ